MATTDKKPVKKIPREQMIDWQIDPDDPDAEEMKTLESWLNLSLNSPSEMSKLAFNIMRQANEGDGQALKILQEISANVRFKNEQKQIVNNEQLRRIILLTSDRIRAEEPTTAS